MCLCECVSVCVLLDALDGDAASNNFSSDPNQPRGLSGDPCSILLTLRPKDTHTLKHTYSHTHTEAGARSRPAKLAGRPRKRYDLHIEHHQKDTHHITLICNDTKKKNVTHILWRKKNKKGVEAEFGVKQFC